MPRDLPERVWARKKEEKEEGGRGEKKRGKKRGEKKKVTCVDLDPPLGVSDGQSLFPSLPLKYLLQYVVPSAMQAAHNLLSSLKGLQYHWEGTNAAKDVGSPQSRGRRILSWVS